RRHRRAAGLTQEELAERAGISVDAISALERGVSRAPQKATIELLAEALRLSQEERTQLEAAARGRLPPEPAAPRETLLHLVQADEDQAERPSPLESEPPQKLALLPAQQRRKPMLLRLAVLGVLLFGTYGGLAYWL